MENKSGVGGEKSDIRTKAKTSDLTVVGVGTLVAAIGPVPISADPDLNVNS